MSTENARPPMSHLAAAGALLPETRALCAPAASVTVPARPTTGRFFGMLLEANRQVREEHDARLATKVAKDWDHAERSRRAATEAADAAVAAKVERELRDEAVAAALEETEARAAAEEARRQEQADYAAALSLAKQLEDEALSAEAASAKLAAALAEEEATAAEVAAMAAKVEAGLRAEAAAREAEDAKLSRALMQAEEKAVTAAAKAAAARDAADAKLAAKMQAKEAKEFRVQVEKLCEAWRNPKLQTENTPSGLVVSCYLPFLRRAEVRPVASSASPTSASSASSTADSGAGLTVPSKTEPSSSSSSTTSSSPATAAAGGGGGSGGSGSVGSSAGSSASEIVATSAVTSPELTVTVEPDFSAFHKLMAEIPEDLRAPIVDLALDLRIVGKDCSRDDDVRLSYDVATGVLRVVVRDAFIAEEKKAGWMARMRTGLKRMFSFKTEK